jgi:hypothetical protein
VLENFRRFWEKERDPERRRELVAQLVERAWIDAGRVVAIQSTPAFKPFLPVNRPKRRPPHPGRMRRSEKRSDGTGTRNSYPIPASRSGCRGRMGLPTLPPGFYVLGALLLPPDSGADAWRPSKRRLLALQGLGGSVLPSPLIRRCNKVLHRDVERPRNLHHRPEPWLL